MFSRGGGGRREKIHGDGHFRGRGRGSVKTVDVFAAAAAAVRNIHGSSPAAAQRGAQPANHCLQVWRGEAAGLPDQVRGSIPESSFCF